MEEVKLDTKHAVPFFWIASYPKSGNTWMRMFLAAYLNGGSLHINYIPAKVGLADDNLALYQDCSIRMLTMTNQYEMLQLRGAFLQRLSVMADLPMFVKTHNARVQIMGVDMCPDAWTQGSIQIIRDPRDVVPSLARHTGSDNDTALTLMLNEQAALHREKHLGGENVRSYMTSWEKFYESWDKSPKPMIRVRYEDMLANPEKEFEEVVRFIDEVNEDNNYKFDRDRLMRSIEATTFDALKKQEQETPFSEASKKAGEFFYKGKSSGGEVLSDEQKAKLKSGLAKAAKKYGKYEL